MADPRSYASLCRSVSHDPPPDLDETERTALRAAIVDATVRRRDDRLRAILQMLWAEETQILETLRQVHAELVSSADPFARRRHWEATL